VGISLEGFTLLSLSSCLLTINGNHTLLYLVFMEFLCMFRTPFGHYVSSRAMFVGFSPGHWIIFWYWHQRSSLWGGHYAMKYALGLLVEHGVCISISIVINWFGYWEKHEGYASACSWYWLLSNEKYLLLCIVAYPTWC
jgi:hypothetical protein